MPFQQSLVNHWVQFESDQIPHYSRCTMLAVARLDPDRRGPHYPLAAFATHTGAILTACTNALRIFSDPLNHLPIKSELALAYDFYTRPWPHSAGYWTDRPDFPFIATCLAVGTTRNEDATSHNRWQLPLAKVYHHFKRDYIDSLSLRVVIDITDPTKVRYAIHHNHPSRHSSYPYKTGAACSKPLSAVDFMTGYRSRSFWFGGVALGDDLDGTLLEPTCRWKVMNVPTLDFEWPHNSSPNMCPPRSLRDQAFVALIRGVAEMESLDITVFEHVCAIPNFQKDLRRHLIKHCADMGNHPPTAQLIALALERQEQLDLAPFRNVSAKSISIILGNCSPEITITSISLCADTLKSSPSEVLQVLARFPTIQNLYLSELPDRRNQSSVKFFTEMLKMPSLIPKGSVLVAGLLSAPLRWGRCRDPIPATSRQIPFDVFPVQHMFVRHQAYGLDQEHFWPNYLSMSDLFLRPERFAVGFIQYLLKIVQPGSSGIEPSEKLFDFCSAASTLDRMYEHYQISQIPLENSGIPLRPRTSRRKENVGDCWPLVRTIEPGSWTVLVSLHHNHITRDPNSLSTRTYHATNWARYAFVRTKARIDVTRSPVKLPPPDEIEVVSLKEFLKITSPETDPALVDMRLEEFEEKAAVPRQVPLPQGVKRLSTMDREEAVGILKDFLNNVEMVKKNLWAFMKEDDSKWPLWTISTYLRHINKLGYVWLTKGGISARNTWYPDLLEESNGQLYGSMVHGADDIFVDSVNAQLSLDWWESDPEEDEEGDAE